jgi:hypothetical protein
MQNIKKVNKLKRDSKTLFVAKWKAAASYQAWWVMPAIAIASTACAPRALGSLYLL